MNSEEPDENTNYALNLGTAINTGALVFFILMPMLLGLVEKALHLTYRNNSTLTNTIHFSLYYGLDITAVILAIKWQKKKLQNKSIEFRKKYLLVVVSIFLVLILLQHL
jgi:hypothetical protein